MISKRIILEPALERRAGSWTASKCRRMAAIFERWARQLRLKAAILDRDAQAPPRHLAFVPMRKAILN